MIAGPHRHVVVTGLGLVSPLGTTLAAFWQGLQRANQLPVELNDHLLSAAHAPNRRFYTVPDAPGFGPGRASAFAVEAARSACHDAGLTSADLADAAVMVGNAAGDADVLERARQSGAKGPCDPLGTYSASAKVATVLAASGPNVSVSTACSAGSYAVCLGAEAIAHGLCDVAVVGGTEGLSRVTQACFNRLWALDDVSCRPFDAERGGTVLGEGAAVLVLETAQRAQARGARPYARIGGYGWSCDAHHPTAPAPDGRRIEAVIRQAMRSADVGASEVDCVIPHGTGTRLNDQVESLTLRRVFGARLASLSCTAPKASLGHGSGAAGAMACAIACLIMRHGEVPPTAHLGTIDEQAWLPLSNSGATKRTCRNVLVNAYAFGGNNVSVVVGGV